MRDGNKQYRGPRRGSSNGNRSGNPGPGNSAEGRNRQFRRGHRRRRSNRQLTAVQVVVKYMNLLEQHLTNRRKYYDYFNRVDLHQRRKLEKNFFTSIEHLRRFEQNLEEWQREALKKATDRYSPDITYTLNHELPPEMEAVPFDGDFDDPHFTAAQRKAFELYREDTEESVGTIEDYQAYKASK